MDQSCRRERGRARIGNWEGRLSDVEMKLEAWRWEGRVHVLSQSSFLYGGSDCVLGRASGCEEEI